MNESQHRMISLSQGTCVLFCSVRTTPDAKNEPDDDYDDDGDECVNIHVT